MHGLPDGLAGGFQPSPVLGLEELGHLLHGQGYVVQVREYHLIAADRQGGPGARAAEVWCQTRPNDRRLWFTHAGGVSICPADQLDTAREAVDDELTPTAAISDGVIDLTALTQTLEADLEARFPGWLITRETTGRWNATRPDWGTLYATTATELGDRLTRHATARP
ncbi:hypothetical protein GCM10022221_35460 [Actinocorallia aurea]